MKKHIITALALAAVVGVGAGVGAIALKDSGRGVRAAASTGTPNYKTFFLDSSSFAGWDNESICLGTWDGTKEVNTYTEAAKIGDHLWTVTIDVDGVDLVEFYRCEKGNAGTHWNKSTYISDFSKNYCSVSNWDVSSTWSTVSASVSLRGVGGDWTTGIPMTNTDGYSDGVYRAQYSLTAQNFTASEGVKAVFTLGSNTYYLEPKTVGASSLDGIAASIVNKNVQINKTAAYNLYVKIAYTGDVEYYFEVLYENEALNFARSFVNALGKTCEGTKNTPVGAAPSALSTAWGTQISNFEDLSENAQNYLLNRDKYEHSELDDLETLYTYIIGKYTGLTHFLTKPSEANVVPQTTINNETNNTPMIATIAAVTGGVILAGGIALFLRRRKQD